MTPQPPSDEKVSADTARRVLERASELDAAHSAATSIAQLREAAREAGIPATAFEQALEEVRAIEQPPVADTSHARRRRVLFWAAAVPGLVIGALTLLFILGRVIVSR